MLDFVTKKYISQIVEKNATNTPGFDPLDKEDISLVEIGPRFCLTPIRIFEGSFGGPTVFENPEFVHPNFVRSALRKDKLQKYSNRQKNQNERDARIKMAEESRETDASDKRVFK